MTSRRYLEEDIRSFAANGAFLVLSVDARDKFGDNGTVGAAIVEAGSGPWRIDTFLLSCRVLGRRIEETLLACLLAEAKARQVKKVIGEFIPTRKNLIAKDFYKKNNFNPVLQQDGKETWEYETARDYPFPEHVILVKDI
jgi:FkbH-like protein